MASRLSLMPLCLACGLPGIHSTPPEKAVVPPKYSSFSTTMTSKPCFFAVIAADKTACAGADDQNIAGEGRG